MWLHYVILLVIKSSNILLNPWIAFPITLFLMAHFFNTPNPIYLLLKIGFLFLHD